MNQVQLTINNHRYELQENLGGGSQGSVWRIRRVEDDKYFALKTLPIKIDKVSNRLMLKKSTSQYFKYLQQEIRFLQSLDEAEQHYIVACIDAGTFDTEQVDDIPALIMPQYPRNLETQLPWHDDYEQVPSLENCLAWMKQIAIALHTIHSPNTNQSHYVHRDLKPGNIMLTDNNEVRLIDFGGGKEKKQDDYLSTLIGTMRYLAPEQVFSFSNENTANEQRFVGTHCDIYSFGIIMYQLLTGHEETQAQKHLADENIQHEHATASITDKYGLLGRIGGLTSREHEDLANILYEKLGGISSNPYATIVPHSLVSPLPNLALLSDLFAKVIHLMLHADYKKRPSASNIKQWIDIFEQARSPIIASVKFEHDEAITTSASEDLSIKLITQGSKGLPGQGNDWIKVLLNGKALNNPIQTLNNSSLLYGLLKKERQEWEVIIPKSTLGLANSPLTLEALVTLGQNTYTDRIEIKLENTAEALWEKQLFPEALRLDPKDTWLDSYEKQSVGSLQAAVQYLNLLQELQRLYPNKTAQLKEREIQFDTNFNHSKRPTPPKSVTPDDHKKKPRKSRRQSGKKNVNIKFAGLVIAIIVLVSFGLFSIIFGESDNKLQRLKAELEHESTRLSALSELHLMSTTNGSDAAKKILLRFEKKSLSMVKSGNSDKAEEGLERLEDSAKRSQTARNMLGEVYYNGWFVRRDWGKAWSWFHKGGSISNKNLSTLEKSADDILLNRDSTPDVRELAYQAAAKAAESSPAGDQAQRWMQYRYLAGDGVPKDAEQAAYWEKRYQGSP